ncbi:PHP domain-containing protein [Treponema sp. OttesenSCG-928-L16]|nr:PHP domain-containing protein [Treponema sp. OttesenSCG-928-L16]
MTAVDCMRRVHTLCTLSRANFRALKKGMYPEIDTLPKQHTPSLQGGIVDFSRDMHIHPFEKGRTREAMDAFVLSALEQGFRTIAFTDHAPMAAECRAKHVMSLEEMEGYVRYAGDLQKVYERDIRILIGIEADHHPLNCSMVEHLRKTYKPDLIIGALHLNTPAWEEAVSGLGPEEVCNFAFDRTLDLVSSGLYDVLAHIDRFVQVLYRLGYAFIPSQWKHRYLEVFRMLEIHNVILELNMNGYNTPSGLPLENCAEMLLWSKPYKIAYTLSSDAHWPKDIGRLFPELRKLLCMRGIIDEGIEGEVRG